MTDFFCAVSYGPKHIIKFILLWRLDGASVYSTLYSTSKSFASVQERNNFQWSILYEVTGAILPCDWLCTLSLVCPLPLSRLWYWCKIHFCVWGVQFSGCVCVCLQTAYISYDYLTAFKRVEYGTKEYIALRSKVDVLFFFMLSAEPSCTRSSFSSNYIILFSSLVAEKKIEKKLWGLYWSQDDLS